MALIAPPPAPALVRVVSAPDGPTMFAALMNLGTSLPQLPPFIVDFQLTGGGAGAVWTTAVVFSDEPVQASVSIPTSDTRIRVVVAATAPELQRQINLAIVDLQVVDGVQWIAKVVEACAGSGAVWMALVVGSTSPRPLPPGPSVTPSTSRAHDQSPTLTLPGDGSIGTLPGLSHVSTTGRVIVTNKVVAVLNAFGPAGSGRVQANPLLDGLPYPAGLFTSSVAYVVPAFDAATLPLGGGWGTIITHAFADPTPGPHAYDLELVHQGPGSDPARVLLLSESTTIVEDVFP